jgi:hypothetical protein
VAAIPLLPSSLQKRKGIGGKGGIGGESTPIHTEGIMEMTLKEALLLAGYSTERVTRENGEFRGMRILKDGVPIHETEVASAQFGWEVLSNQAQEQK